MTFLRFLRCFFTGHVPSGYFAALTGGRVVQYCAHCEGWLGDMFWWRPCDSGSGRNGEKPTGFECEASQSGPKGIAQPSPPSSPNK